MHAPKASCMHRMHHAHAHIIIMMFLNTHPGPVRWTSSYHDVYYPVYT
jgi:hypothetical protein